VVPGAQHLRRLAEEIKDHERAVERWLVAYQNSTMRLPHPVAMEEMRRIVQPIVENLWEALSEGKRGEGASLAHLTPGLPELREVEKSVAFIGGTLAAGANSNGFDVAALILSLREVLVPYLDEAARQEISLYLEWLSVLALDSFSSARAQIERERTHDQLEQGTPVVQIVPELPAALLVGRPDRSVLESIFARVTLLCVRVGAVAAIVDGTGLSDQEDPELLLALEQFLNHRKIAGQVEILAVGLNHAAEARWSEIARKAISTLRAFPYFDRAVERGLQTSGYRLVRT
jgi:hypothetical protein